MQAAARIAKALSVGRHAPIKRLVAKNFPDVRRFPTVQPPEIRIGDPATLVTAIVEASSKGALVDGDRAIEDRLREILSVPARPEPAGGPLDPDDPDRFPGNWDERVAEYRDRDYPLQLTHRGVYGFPREIMGDENLAYAFYDDPKLVHNIMDAYTDVAISIWEKMVSEVDFDIIECWEDMASRNGSIISPKTFREFMTPNYQKIAEFAKAHDIPIILVDSDGYIEELTGLMLEGGVTALYPYEVQSGNDVAGVLDRFPTVGVVGGLNKQAMAQGKEAIDREMEKARTLIQKGRFIPGPDHFVLSDVTWANYRYFMESLREVVMTTKPES